MTPFARSITSVVAGAALATLIAVVLPSTSLRTSS